jgi:hypothetical protein
MGDVTTTSEDIGWKPEGRKERGISSSRWEDNIKLGHK